MESGHKAAIRNDGRDRRLTRDRAGGRTEPFTPDARNWRSERRSPAFAGSVPEAVGLRPCASMSERRASGPRGALAGPPRPPRHCPIGAGGFNRPATRGGRCRRPRRRWRSRRGRAGGRGRRGGAGRGRGPGRRGRCRAGGPRRRRGSRRRPARACATPPTPISGSRPSVIAWSLASTTVEGTKSGCPERPPASRGVAAGEAVAGQRGVGGDDAGDAAVERRLGELGEGAVVEVGGDLQEHRHRPGEAGVGRHDAGEQRGEGGAALKLAQALGVRRGDVDGGEVDEGAGDAEHLGEVGGAVGAVLVGAEVEADDAAGRPGGEAGGDGGGAVVVEAEAVDDGAVPRTGGTGAGAGCRAAGAGWRRRPRRSRSRRGRARRRLGRSCRGRRRGRAGSAGRGRRGGWRAAGVVIGPGRGPRPARSAEDGEPVRGLGIEAAQERQAEIGEAHGRPSSTGRDQRTSVLASGR